MHRVCIQKAASFCIALTSMHTPLCCVLDGKSSDLYTHELASNSLVELVQQELTESFLLAGTAKGSIVTLSDGFGCFSGRELLPLEV